MMNQRQIQFLNGLLVDLVQVYPFFVMTTTTYWMSLYVQLLCLALHPTLAEPELTLVNGRSPRHYSAGLGVCWPCAPSTTIPT
jgi:hypothetical protein